MPDMPKPSIAVVRRLVASLCLVGLISPLGCAGGPASPSGSAPPPSGTTASLTPSGVPEVALGPGTAGPIPTNAIKIDLGHETNGVAACAGWVWVQVHSDADAIVQVDPSSGEIIGQVDGGTNLACIEGVPWAAVDGVELRHLDAATRSTVSAVAVDTFYVGGGAGSVWAPSGQSVVRIDPTTAKIVATIPSLQEVTEVEGNDDGIWATVKRADTVYRIDPATNAVVASITAGAFAHGILVQADAVWISNGHEDSVTRIDPRTSTAVAFIEGAGAGVGLAQAGGFIWASSRNGLLYRIDPATSQATPVVRIGGWPYGMDATEDVLWVSDGLSALYGIPIAELLPE